MNKEKQEIIDWLSGLIDTSIICLRNEQPSVPHDKLLFQLKAKLKELNTQDTDEVKKDV